MPVSLQTGRFFCHPTTGVIQRLERCRQDHLYFGRSRSAEERWRLTLVRTLDGLQKLAESRERYRPCLRRALIAFQLGLAAMKIRCAVRYCLNVIERVLPQHQVGLQLFAR